MKLDLKKIKGLIIEKTKEFVEEYYKIVFAVLVVLALVILCGVTLVNRMLDEEIPSGVMMTISDVASDEEPFAGKTFYAEGITYNDMVNVGYELEMSADLDKAEQEIEEILAAKRQEREKEAAEELLAMEHYSPGEYEYVPVVTLPTSSPSAGAVYADASGTYVSLGEFELTAYCPCPICCGKYSNMENPTTASGTRATANRTIATDTSVIPFGTKVVINGQVYTAEDTGGAIVGNRIDIYFDSHTTALQFGRQKATVYKQQ